MDEPNSRIFGYLRTGANGRCEFRTVRPSGYSFPLPNRTGGRALVPAHIHFIVSAE
jgi:protocatechuate 3,4-dioxygenase beta subunit